MEDQRQFNFRSTSKNETFLLSSNVDDFNDKLQDKLKLNSVNFSRARKRRESAAIFDRLNEDTSINLLNDPLELQTFEEEDVFEFLPKEIVTPEMKLNNYTPISRIEKNTEIMCFRDTTLQNDGMSTPWKHLSTSSENTLENIREISKTTYHFFNDENGQAINNTLINETNRTASTLQKRSKQDLTSIDNINDESLLIARTTLNQFKEAMSKFKAANSNAQPPLPVKSDSKSELLANLSHIKCPDDVVCLINHHLYSPIGIHRTYPAQKIKMQETLDINVNDLPLREHATKEFGKSRLFQRYEKRKLSTQINEITKVSMDFQQPVLLGDLSKVSTNDKGKILRYGNNFSLDSLTHSQQPENNPNNERAISQASHKSASTIDSSNNEKQRNNTNESSVENLYERNEFRKRKRTAEKPLSPHLSCINDSNKIQAKSAISPTAKKVKTQSSNLRAPTSISRLKYNTKKKGGSLNSSNMDSFKASTSSRLRLPRRTSNIKQQWK
ncbi:hypothetical protein RclHR1_07370009 [Rhizophagus clarus]|uniref:Uncharacterized protein n=1 Tax=Rhizophagus clarus TaxID=94130 RepID=A0A2Z6SC09_9GLOM|nr:hypothetical protein RclHR1_07370009 [Rhizophagus clarus]GES86746.1 hypothetical protein GLOIN_2v1660025 [Rhizophagus clarus]